MCTAYNLVIRAEPCWISLSKSEYDMRPRNFLYEGIYGYRGSIVFKADCRFQILEGHDSQFEIESPDMDHENSIELVGVNMDR